MKKSIKIVLVIMFLNLSCYACYAKIKTENNSENKDKISKVKTHSLGLQADVNGALKLNGRQFKGVGVNYFNAFYRNLQNGSDTTYNAGFRYLKSQHIPFVRFMAGAFWPKEWNLYLTNKAEYFAKLDELVRSAENQGIGLIPSLFWQYSTVPDIVGESVNQWGNVNSKTIQFMKTYTGELIKRYKDSPAIWGWEFGNEFNLSTDLPGDTNNLPPVTVENGTPPFRTKADKLSTPDLHVALTEFAKAVRLYDASRIIVSGNANPRPFAYHLYTTKSWVRDSEQEYGDMLDKQNPDPVNTISIHHYPENAYEYFADQKASNKEIIRVTMADAVRRKKPLFIGEFGASETQVGVAEARQKFFELLEGIEESKVPLAAVWVFDYPPQDTAGGGWNIGPDNGPREYMLQAIKELNLRLQ